MSDTPPTMPDSRGPRPTGDVPDPRATATPGQASMVAMFGNGACWCPDGSNSYGPAMGDPFDGD